MNGTSKAITEAVTALKARQQALRDELGAIDKALAALACVPGRALAAGQRQTRRLRTYGVSAKQRYAEAKALGLQTKGAPSWAAIAAARATLQNEASKSDSVSVS